MKKIDKLVPGAQVLEIYRAYPRQVARGYAIGAISSAIRRISREGIQNPAQFLYEKVVSFSQSDIASDKSKSPMCHSWMDADRWADDPSEWNEQ